MSQTSPKIVIYLKTFCGWSEGVRVVMRKYRLAYEEKDVVKNPAFRWEMEQRSGQPLCPCVEVDGHILVDVSGEEVEKWLIQNEYVCKDEVAEEEPSHTLRDEPPLKVASPAKVRLPAKASKSRFFD
ncbi:MAG: glutaredoxin [Verrucomicrobia bacterium]|nr:MAG: glutaredoxin [Verrucomicrobiota bacterium]